jgi:hypothetical protein
MLYLELPRISREVETAPFCGFLGPFGYGDNCFCLFELKHPWHDKFKNGADDA